MVNGIRDIMGLTLHWWNTTTVRDADTISLSAAIGATTASKAVNSVVGSVGVSTIVVTKKMRQ